MTDKNDHITSLRIPADWHIWTKQFAAKYNITPSYIYRSAIREFIKLKSNQAG